MKPSLRSEESRAVPVSEIEENLSQLISALGKTDTGGITLLEGALVGEIIIDGSDVDGESDGTGRETVQPSESIHSKNTPARHNQ
jgi:hypothetical protein